MTTSNKLAGEKMSSLPKSLIISRAAGDRRSACKPPTAASAYRAAASKIALERQPDLPSTHPVKIVGHLPLSGQEAETALRTPLGRVDRHHFDKRTASFGDD